MKILDKVVSKKYILAMKKGILWLFSVLMIVSAVYAGAYLYDLQAWNENDNVRLEWKTLEEVNLENFVIERKRLPREPLVHLQRQTFWKASDGL